MRYTVEDTRVAHAGLFCLLLGSLTAAGSLAAPIVFWASQPVAAGSIVQLVGSGLLNGSVSVCPLRQGAALQCVPCTALQSADTSLKFTLPTLSGAVGINANMYMANVSVCTSSGCSAAITVNAPAVDWTSVPSCTSTQCAAALDGDTSVPLVTGGRLRIFGSSLAWNLSAASPTSGCVGSTHAGASSLSFAQLAAQPGGAAVPLTTRLASCYRLDVDVPSTVTPMPLYLLVDNGLGGCPLPGCVITRVNVLPPPLPPSVLFVLGVNCTTVLNCVQNASVAAAAGTPANVSLPAGAYVLPAYTTLNLTTNVTLMGAGSDATYLVWQGIANSSASWGPGIVTGVSQWAIQDLAVLVTPDVAPTLRAGLPAVFIGPGSVGVSVRRVLVSYNTTNSTGSAGVIGPPIAVGQEGAAPPVLWSIRDSTFAQEGLCSSTGWPRNCGFYVQSASWGEMTGNTFIEACQGWSIDSSRRILFDSNNVVTVATGTSEGSGINSFAQPQVTDNIYFSNNTLEGNPESTYRYETFTLDGAGMTYFGNVSEVFSNVTGTFVQLTSSPSASGDFTDAMFIVMGGMGLGQIRRIVSYAGATWQIDRDFDVPLDPTSSIVSIQAFRGSMVFDGNLLINGTTFQLYGTSIGIRIVENTFYNLNLTNAAPPLFEGGGGVLMWGKTYQGGIEPSYYVTADDNTLECATRLSSHSSLDATQPPSWWTGPFVFAHAHRRNTLSATPEIVDGRSMEVLVEGSRFLAVPCPWSGGGIVPAASLFVNASVSDVWVSN